MSSLETAARAQLGLGATQAQVTEWFQGQLLAALSDPLFNLPKVFLTYIADYVATSGLNIPIGQVIGFDQFTVQGPSYVGATETTTSIPYTNLATTGPSLTGLSDGLYLWVFGGVMSGGGAGSFSRMSLKYNTTEADDGDNCQTESTSLLSVSRATSSRLAAGGNNTVTARYRTAGGTGTYAGRWLLGLRISN